MDLTHRLPTLLTSLIYQSFSSVHPLLQFAPFPAFIPLHHLLANCHTRCPPLNILPIPPTPLLLTSLLATPLLSTPATPTSSPSFIPASHTLLNASLPATHSYTHTRRTNTTTISSSSLISLLRRFPPRPCHPLQNHLIYGLFGNLHTQPQLSCPPPPHPNAPIHTPQAPTCTHTHPTLTHTRSHSSKLTYLHFHSFVPSTRLRTHLHAHTGTSCSSARKSWYPHMHVSTTRCISNINIHFYAVMFMYVCAKCLVP
ncbi:hypothetical protein E2C01_101232 [Portunus trituberculatus]|uniref:Uncharacterized protein n=1 Tax=Portunus trituberculatus TaxID=210409 RepID=A0A5B7KF33_PORTR|nr:hypothetical protein [Portunus trituberculatus]